MLIVSTKNFSILFMVSGELKKAESDPNTRVVILRGKGENYSSGADLSKF